MKKIPELILALNFIFFILAYIVIGDAHGWLKSLSYLLPALLAVIFAGTAVRTYSAGNIHSRSFILLGLGLLFWAIGEIIWVYMDMVLDIYPFPSIADIAYVSAYPFLLAGLIVEIKSRQLKLSFKSKYIIAGLSALLIFLFAFFQVPTAYDPLAGFWENGLGIFYVLGDIILLIIIALLAAVALEYRNGKVATASFILMSSMIMVIVADIFYSIYYEAYENDTAIYTALDAMWVMGYLLFAYYFIYMTSLVKSVQTKIE